MTEREAGKEEEMKRRGRSMEGTGEDGFGEGKVFQFSVSLSHLFPTHLPTIS